MMTQGYLALAAGPRRYVDLAMNLAASIRVMDPGRPICLIHDRHTEIPPEAAALFDDFACLPDDPAYRPLLNKLRLFDVSPYERSMFVDADCLLVRRDISEYWDECSGRPFAITGGIRTDGRWKGHQIQTLMRTYGAAYVVQMNSGVFYFDKSDAARTFFSGLNAFYRVHSETLITLEGHLTYDDEPFFGVYMGRVGMTPSLGANGRGGTIMATTWRAPFCHVDMARGRSVLVKPKGFFYDIPVLPRGFDRLSPTFMHFVGLKPRRLYRRAAARFREAARAA